MFADNTLNATIIMFRKHFFVCWALQKSSHLLTMKMGEFRGWLKKNDWMMDKRTEKRKDQRDWETWAAVCLSLLTPPTPVGFFSSYFPTFLFFGSQRNVTHWQWRMRRERKRAGIHVCVFSWASVCVSYLVFFIEHICLTLRGCVCASACVFEIVGSQHGCTIYHKFIQNAL